MRVCTIDVTPQTPSAPHVLDQRLHYLVLVGHVGHHVGHVVLGGSHQSGSEHDGQVSGLHLDGTSCF